MGDGKRPSSRTRARPSATPSPGPIRDPARDARDDDWATDFLRQDPSLRACTLEHYADAELYDHEYRRRRADVNYYRDLAAGRLPHVANDAAPDVLELGCGSGRLLVPLVRDGVRTVGIDLSLPMLRRLQARLRALAPTTRARARVLRADFRRFALSRRFPLIVCPFNAMMHCYGTSDVERFLARVKEHLAPGGTFAFDVLSPDLRWLTRDSEKRWSRTRFKDPRDGRTYFYSTNHAYDAATQINWIRIFYDEEPVARRAARVRSARVIHLAQRQFFPEELMTLLRYNGFVVDAREGNFAGGTFDGESDSQVVRCRVAADARNA